MKTDHSAMVATMAIAMVRNHFRRARLRTFLSTAQKSMVDPLRLYPSRVSLTFERCSVRNIQTSLSKSIAAACSYLQSLSFKIQILKTLSSDCFDTCCGFEKWIPFFTTPNDKAESHFISRVVERRRSISVPHLLWKIKM